MECPACGAAEEVYLKKWDAPTPDCPICLQPRTRLASRFGVVFTGPITRKYMDQKKEGAEFDGFWDYRVKSSLSGQPEPVRIETFDQLREFNKAEGLTEVSAQCSMGTDGKTLSSAGMPGNWQGGGMPSIPSRLKEIIEMPADQIPQAAATATPRMPADHGVRFEVAASPEEAKAVAERMAGEAAACRAEIGK